MRIALKGKGRKRWGIKKMRKINDIKCYYIMYVNIKNSAKFYYYFYIYSMKSKLIIIIIKNFNYF